MNHIFHARITWYQYLYLIIIGLLAFWFLWNKSIIPATFCMLLLVVLIERFIHTTYTLTKERTLLINTGRFSKDKVIKLEEIRSVEKRYSHLGRLTRTGFVLIRYGDDKYVSVTPIKEREFVKMLL